MFKPIKFLSLITFLLLLASASYANTIVRLSVVQGGAQDDLFLKLFDESKPVTTSNFMSYVTDRSYDNGFVHRVGESLGVPFIIQGGGYKFDPNNVDFVTSASPLTSKGAIINEPGISNLRGTIAMAKAPAQFVEGPPCVVEGPGCTLVPGTGPDSATSEWFINLDDNNASFLDTDNGGFTVFGEVINNGMGLVDSIAAQTTYDFGSPFAEIPLIDFITTPILISNLVKVPVVEGLLRITQGYDYKTVTPGSNLQPLFFIENISQQDIFIGDIGGLNPAEAPFRVIDLECKFSVLVPGEICYFVTSFSPISSGTFPDSFDIDFPGLGLNYIVQLTGEGGAVVAEPDISIAFSDIGFRHSDMATVDITGGDVESKTVNVTLQNIGDAQLNISSVVMETVQDDEFSLSGTCLTILSLEVNEQCSVAVALSPVSAGEKSAVVVITSNDPDESIFDLTINALATSENDGVDDAVENAGPNNGDGNYDGILDSIQGNVVTLPDLNGNYVTYIGQSGVRFRNVHFSDRSGYSNIPDDIAIETNVFEFSVDEVKVGDVTRIGLILPANKNPDKFNVNGVNEDNTEQHWFNFVFDGETGTAIIPGGTFVAESGQSVPGTFVTLLIKNSGRGDSSFDEDETLVVTGGFNHIYGDDSSGRFSILFVLLTFSLILLMRNIRLSIQSRN